MRCPTRKSLAATLVLTGFGFGVTGQTAAQAPTPPVVVESIVVTGSNVPTTPDAVAVPVTILGAEQMEQTGITSNVLEILRKAIPSFAGRGNTGNSNANNTNQNTAGGSQVLLRNLDTLVLINGRRVATNGINAIGGKSFVDVNQIPAAAIDRIEVLTDGSSAIYGSDAIGGVVNIILKTEFEGAEVGGRYGWASNAGDYTERSGYFVGGKELSKGVNITVAASSSHTDPLFQRDRGFTSPLTGRVSAVPGAVTGGLLAAGLNSPSARNPTGTAATAPSLASLIANGTYIAATPAQIAATFDISQFQTLLLKQDQDSFISTFTADLLGNEKLVFFGDFMYSRTRSFTQFLPITTTNTVAAGTPFNPLTTNFAGVSFAYLPSPKQFANDADGTRVTAGLRGELTKNWTWEAAYVYSENLLDQEQRNVLYRPNIARAIAGGFDAQGNPVPGGRFSRVAGGFSESNPFVIQPALDPFARTDAVDPASLANLLGTQKIHAASRLTSVDAKVVGRVFELPAGKLGVAFGGSTRRETLAGESDPNGRNTAPGTSTCISANFNCQLWTGGTASDPFSADRRVDAVFAEALAPIASAKWNFPGAHVLDLIAAVRGERYSDVGNSTVPKLGFRWQPMDAQLTVRGTYAKSFTAPTLFALSGPTGTRFIGSGVINTVFAIPNLQFNGEDGNNPDLKPSKARSYSIGMVLVPTAVKGLRFAADYSDINQEGFPGGIGFTNILDDVNRLGAASPFAANLTKGNFPGQPGAIPFTAPGQVLAFLQNPANSPGGIANLFAIDQFRNLGGIKEQSINLTAEYEFPTEKAGVFLFTTSGAIFLHYKFQALTSQPFFEYAGFATNGGTGVQGTLPKYRFYSAVNWKYQDWDATLANTYISSVTDIGPGGIVFANSTTLKPIPVSRYVTWDVRLGYTEEKASGSVPLIKGWRAAVGVNNLTNRMPPLAPQAFTDNNADVSTYSPIGRLFYTSLAVKF